MLMALIIGVLISILFWILLICFIISVLINGEIKPISKRKTYYDLRIPNYVCNVKNESDSYEPSYSSFEFYLKHETSIIQMFAEQVWTKEHERSEVIIPLNKINPLVLPSYGLTSNAEVVKANPNNSIQLNENLVYKELLNTPQWKSKRNEILKRDHYTCQWCRNIVKLQSLLDLDFLVDDFNMANIIRSVFGQRDEIIAQKSCFTNIGKYKPKLSTFLDSEKIYVHQYEICKTIYDVDRICLVSNNKEGKQFVRFTHVLSESYSYIYKGKSEKSNRITIECSPETSTNDNYYITHLFDYSKEPYRSQCLITCNGFTIIFPLYNYKEFKVKLNTIFKPEVHHLLYRRELTPWEYNNNELITLCENCHNYCHREHNIPIVDKDETYNLT